MPLATTIRRHHLILQRLENGPATREELTDYIYDHTAADYEPQRPSRRTFLRDKEAILTLYKKQIFCNDSDHRYFLADTDDTHQSLRILEAYDLAHLMNAAEPARSHVLFEKRRPRGTNLFQPLLEAIRQRLMVRCRYESYYEECITARLLCPYALKEFKGRWYLLAKDNKDGVVKTFGLDRIHDLMATHRAFAWPTGFNPEAHFADCFGITGPDMTEPADIVLSFEPLQGRYVKSFPLHESQRILHDGEDEVRIGLRLHVTHDLVMELLSYGGNVRVLSPESLAGRMGEEYRVAAALYA